MATKTISKDFTDMGFTKEMFTGAEDLSVFLQGVIDEVEGLLSDRIGTSAYDSATASVARQVKRAAKCLVAAELCKLRKVKMIGFAKANGEEAKTTEINIQIADYTAEAERWIDKLVSGVTSDTGDFASGALVTDHFGGTGS